METNRRGFLGFLGAAAATAIVKPAATVVRFVAPKIGVTTPTWAITEFDRIVVATLRNNSEQLAKHAMQTNALLRHLMRK